MESQVELSSKKSFDFNDALSAATSLHDTDEDSPSKFDGADLLLPESKKIQKKRTKYHRIDDNLRKKLIDAVVEEGQMLKAAAKRYKINYSSAKSIFHTYRKEGRVNKKAVRERYARKLPNPSKGSQSNSLSSLTPETNSTGLNSVGESSLNNSENAEAELQQSSLDMINRIRVAQIEALEREARQSLQNLTKPKPSEKSFPLSEALLMPGPNVLQQYYLNMQRMEMLANAQRAFQGNLRALLGKPQFTTLPQFPLIQNDQMLNSQFPFKNLNAQSLPLLSGMGLLKGFAQGAENVKN